MADNTSSNTTPGTEARTADTMLQRPVTVTIGGRDYEAAPPSLATLMLASEAIAELPPVPPSPDNVLSSCLGMARHCGPIARVLAILILGARDCCPRAPRRQWWQLHRRDTAPDPVTALARRIATEATPRQLNDMAAQLLGGMQVGDFFALTTFLAEANMTRPTKVVTAATAPGL